MSNIPYLAPYQIKTLRCLLRPETADNTKALAYELGVSYSTAKQYMHNILQVLRPYGVTGRVSMALWAERSGRFTE